MTYILFKIFILLLFEILRISEKLLFNFVKKDSTKKLGF